ncbi:periplasmic heavy metal sensor [Lacinutrix sp. WUR7]|uniref:Spy/CpxP family protein refolding chaperone n=1 Tax=Lacinutrix sp. WUR7 TaxID=2653681 RepID=UPI00193DE32B|nr:periplasmic heavy metal sensor [Lacinutrix sp. WUR7]QRM90225.1 periplasmic heavy metal sensor [Lacinutrix sp. WUR7]
MKKNTVLYILLVFLIVVNGFFVFNYVGKSNDNKAEGRKDPMSFLRKELKFNDAQQEKLQTINVAHHENMMHSNNALRDLKDALLNNISNASVDEKTIDSITSLIGKEQANLEKEVYYHFNSIHDICDEKQKEKFKKIIKDALRRGGDEGGRPPRSQRPERPEGHRPPPPPNDF